MGNDALCRPRDDRHDPHTQVAHRAAVCARPACPRTPTSTTTTHPDVLFSAAAQECAHMRRSASWRKNALRTSARSAMGICARSTFNACRIFERIYRLHRLTYHHLSSHTRSSLLLVLTGTARKMQCVQPHTSSSVLSVCASTFQVDLVALVYVVYQCVGHAHEVRLYK